MPEKVRVLVTGANGLLGANVVAALNKKGFSVTALVRNNSSIKALEGLDFKLIRGNITDISDLVSAMQGCTAVVHCAGQTRQYPVAMKYYEKINIYSTSLLLETCKKQGIKKFIHVSTANSFVNGTMVKPGDETGGFSSWLKKSGYAYSKYISQRIVLNEVQSSDFPAMVVAPTFLIGPRDARPSSGQALLYAIKNKAIFCPPGGKNIVDAEFAAEAIVNGLNNFKKGGVFLLAGENISYSDFFRCIASETGNKRLIIRLPRLLMVVIGWLGSFLYNISGLPIPLTHVNQRLLCLHNYYSGKAAQEKLGLQKTIPSQAIKKAIVWFRANNMI